MCSWCIGYLQTRKRMTGSKSPPDDSIGLHLGEEAGWETGPSPESRKVVLRTWEKARGITHRKERSYLRT